jgi:hypothetical protein
MRIFKHIFSLLKKVVCIDLIYLYLCDVNNYSKKHSKDFRVIKGTNEDLKRLKSMANDERYHIFEKRMELKNDLYLLEYKDKIIGGRWLSKDLRIFPPEKLINYFPQNTFYAYDGFVSKNFRGRGLFGLITSKMLDDNLDKRIILGSYSSFFNKSAQKAKEKYNSRKKSLIFTIIFLNRFQMTKKIKSYN